MSQSTLRKLTAFAMDPSGGNPAGAWVGDELPEPRVMQDIARRVGFSETALIPTGIYNGTDDEPLTSLDLMTAQALAVGGSPPRRLPPWIGRLALRDALGILTVSQRVSNRRFREASGWAPSLPDAAMGATSLQGSSGR